MRKLRHRQKWPQRQRISAIPLQKLRSLPGARSGLERVFRRRKAAHPSGLPGARVQKRDQPHLWGKPKYPLPLAQKKGHRAKSIAEQVDPAEENDVLELDECWTYVRQRSNKRWLWVALCRRTRQIVAFVIGDRSAKTCARLWAKIPSEYREKQSFSDFWKSYRPVFEEDSTHEQVGKGSGELSHVERFFGLIRQRLSRYARETRSASQTERMLHLRTKLFVDTYNQAVT